MSSLRWPLLTPRLVAPQEFADDQRVLSVAKAWLHYRSTDPAKNFGLAPLQFASLCCDLGWSVGECQRLLGYLDPTGVSSSIDTRPRV